MMSAVSIDNDRRTGPIRNFVPKSPDAIEKLTLRQAFGLPVVWPDKQCRMHRQQSALPNGLRNSSLMSFVALDGVGLHAGFKSFKQFKSLNLQVLSQILSD